MTIRNYGFLLFQDPTEKVDDTNQGDESTEMPSSDETTASTEDETDMIESDDDDTKDDDTETDEEEDVFEPRSFPSGPKEEQESEDDHVVIEAKDNSDPEGCNSIDILNFGRKTGPRTWPSFAPSFVPKVYNVY